MSRMFNALSMQFKKQVAEGAGVVAFDGVKCYTPKATFYGECLQDGTPTPESPVPVLCNNAKWTTPVWNQMVIPHRSGTTKYVGVDVSYNADGTITFNGEATSTGNYLDIGTIGNYVAGHKYLLSVIYLSGTISGDSIRVLNTWNFTLNIKSEKSNNLIYTAPANPDFRMQINAGSILSQFNIEVITIDLTALFGPGNEPSAVKEFKEWAKANGHDLDTYQPRDTGTPIGGTVDLSLLPDGGLYGISDVQDEWDCVSGDGIRRFGKVDLGTLNYGYAASHAFFYALIENAKGTGTTGIIPNIICPYYTAITSRYDAGWDIADNMTISLNINGTQVQIKNDSYTDASTFKAAMSGVMLYYELDTPVPFHATPQPLIQSNELNTLTQINGDIAETDVTVEYVKHS